jgi:hypothetical protein
MGPAWVPGPTGLPRVAVRGPVRRVRSVMRGRATVLVRLRIPVCAGVLVRAWIRGRAVTPVRPRVRVCAVMRGRTVCRPRRGRTLRLREPA